MSKHDLVAHLRDLLDIKDDLETLSLHGYATIEDVENVLVAVGNMAAGVTARIEEVDPDPSWLASTWVSDGRAIITEKGELIAVTMGPFITEYILATHHTFRDIPYAGGQLELENVET